MMPMMITVKTATSNAEAPRSGGDLSCRIGVAYHELGYNLIDFAIKRLGGDQFSQADVRIGARARIRADGQRLIGRSRDDPEAIGVVEIVEKSENIAHFLAAAGIVVRALPAAHL